MDIEKIFELHDFPMVYAYYNYQVNSGILCRCNGLPINSRLKDIKSQLAELVVAVSHEAHEHFRVGLAKFLVAVLKMACHLDMTVKVRYLRDKFIEEKLFPREDYVCYVDDLYLAVLDMEQAVQEGAGLLIQDNVIRILARIYLQLPEFCRFAIRDDLIAIMRGKLLEEKEVLDPIRDEETKWYCYRNYKFKAYALIEVV